MNLPAKCKRFSLWLFKSQKKSDFSALPGPNAKKSLEEILPEIANSLQLRIVLPPSNPKETHINFGDAGLELATSWSQTKRSSHLS